MRPQEVWSGSRGGPLEFTKNARNTGLTLIHTLDNDQVCGGDEETRSTTSNGDSATLSWGSSRAFLLARTSEINRSNWPRLLSYNSVRNDPPPLELLTSHALGFSTFGTGWFLVLANACSHSAISLSRVCRNRGLGASTSAFHKFTHLSCRAFS
jgi:hypothetical protein